MRKNILHLLKVNTEMYDGPKGFSCSLLGCNKRELTEVLCEHCHLNMCLSHRLQQDHNCKHLVERSVPNAKTAQHVAGILANKAPRQARKPLKSLKSRQTAARVALMKLKSKAEGDKSIPEPDRVFFSMALPRVFRLAPKPIFVSKAWVIGRVIDYLAHCTGINNPNNTAAENKLRLFSGDNGAILPVDRKIEEIMTDEFAVFNGSPLILELVDQNVNELPNLQEYQTTS